MTVSVSALSDRMVRLVIPRLCELRTPVSVSALSDRMVRLVVCVSNESGAAVSVSALSDRMVRLNAMYFHVPQSRFSIRSFGSYGEDKRS